MLSMLSLLATDAKRARFGLSFWLLGWPKVDFRREVERELTGKETEPSELIYFKVYKSQIPGDRAGNGDGSSDAGHGQIARLLPGDDLRRLPGRRQPGQREFGGAAVFDDEILRIPASRPKARISGRPEREGLMSSIGQKLPRLRLDPVSYESLRQRILRRDGWRCQSCGTMSNLEVHHSEFRSHSGADSEENLITLCAACHAAAHRR